MQTFVQFVTEGVTGWFYHGSSCPEITSFNFKEDGKFQLLGSGIYFYQKRESAKQYGNNIYKVKLSDFKLAPQNFEFTHSDLHSIFNKEFSTTTDPAGITKPIWWATDGWDYYGYSRLARSEVIGKIAAYMQSHYGFDGMLAEYPNGGIVACVWRHFDKLHPIQT
jgi:hypothetical protein